MESMVLLCGAIDYQRVITPGMEFGYFGDLYVGVIGWRDNVRRNHAMAELRTTEELRRILETEVLTGAEAAEYLGMTRQNIHIQVKQGRLPCVRGKFFLKADLDEYDSKVITRHPRKKWGEQNEAASKK